MKYLLDKNKEKLRNKQFTRIELCKTLGISSVAYDRNKEQIKSFLKEISSQIIKEKPTVKYLLDKNKEKLRNKQLTRIELCKILNISSTAYNNNKEQIKNFLKEIGSQIIKENPTAKYLLDKNKEKLRNKQFTRIELCKTLGISESTYSTYKEIIQDFLKEIGSQIIKEKSSLQNSFYEQVIELPNVKIVEPEIIINCKTEANDTIEKIIKGYDNFLKSEKQNIAKNTKTIVANKNDQKLNILMNYLNKYLNDLSKSKFDFYVETFSGNRYLVQCQGDHHYDLQSRRNNNVIRRIVIDVAKMLVACKYNCNFIATYDVKLKKRTKESLDVFNKFYMTTEEAIQLIKNEGTVSKYKIKSCAINMLNKIRKAFEDRIDLLSKKIKDQIKTNREILEQIRKY